MILSRIVDGHGSENSLKINGEGEIAVVAHSHPPRDESVESYPFSQWFTDDGLSSGSNDLRVNGSTTSRDFYIAGRESFDIYIKTISVQISDNGSALNKFGALAALTNGVDFLFSNDSLGEIFIQQGMKTNLDMVRLAISTGAIGTGTDAYKADISGGGADTYLPTLDLSVTFGFPWGLRLKKGSNDKITFRVNDDLSVGIDAFNVKGFGVIF